MDWFLTNKQHIVQNVCYRVERDGQRVQVLAIVDEAQMRRLLDRILDPDEFLSPYGLRSLSRFHERHPFRMGTAELRYEPGEAESKIKGGNSHWRGAGGVPPPLPLVRAPRH